MADPILGLSELVEGDPLGYLRQNDRNLVVSRLGVAPHVLSNGLTTPPADPARGDTYIVAAGGGTGLWAGAAQHDVMIALSASPVSTTGWFRWTPIKGWRCWVEGQGAPVTWNGSAYV